MVVAVMALGIEEWVGREWRGLWVLRCRRLVGWVRFARV